MDESLRGLERRARAGDREAARAWLAAVRRAGGQEHPWARAVTSLIAGDARGLAEDDPAWQGLARAAALFVAEPLFAGAAAGQPCPEAATLLADLRACATCPCYDHEPEVAARGTQLEERLQLAVPPDRQPWADPPQPLTPGALAAARALAWAARAGPGAGRRAAAEAAVREALLALAAADPAPRDPAPPGSAPPGAAHGRAPDRAPDRAAHDRAAHDRAAHDRAAHDRAPDRPAHDRAPPDGAIPEPGPEHLERLLRQLLPPTAAQDFPAAHSMDTNWFAADGDGHLAMFSTGSNGALPQGAYADPDLHWTAPELLGPLPGSAWWLDLVGSAPPLPDAPAPGLAVPADPRGPLGALWSLPAGRWTPRPAQPPIPPPHLPPPPSPPGQPWRHALVLLEDPGPLEPALSSGAARLIDLPGPLAVHVDRLDVALHEALHTPTSAAPEGPCLGCRVQFHPLQVRQDPQLQWRDLTRPAPLGLFSYAHAIEAWGVAGPYGRTAVPFTPLRLSQLPARLAQGLFGLRFPGVCFQELVLFQPARLVPCRAHPRDALEEDLRTRIPLRGRLDPPAMGWLVLAGREGEPDTPVTPTLSGLGHEDLAALSEWLTGEDHLRPFGEPLGPPQGGQPQSSRQAGQQQSSRQAGQQQSSRQAGQQQSPRPAGQPVWQLPEALTIPLSALADAQRPQLERWWRAWSGDAAGSVDGATLFHLLREASWRARAEGRALLLRQR